MLAVKFAGHGNEVRGVSVALGEQRAVGESARDETAPAKSSFAALARPARARDSAARPSAGGVADAQCAQ